MRAARMLWAKIVKQFNPKNPKSSGIAYTLSDFGWSLTEQDPFNNVDVLVSKQWLPHWDILSLCIPMRLTRLLRLPTDFSARIARNTQIYIQEETYICKNVDPGVVLIM